MAMYSRIVLSKFYLHLKNNNPGSIEYSFEVSPEGKEKINTFKLYHIRFPFQDGIKNIYIHIYVWIEIYTHTYK